MEPRLVIELALGGRPRVYVDAVSEGEAWIASCPELAALLEAALALVDAGSDAP